MNSPEDPNDLHAELERHWLERYLTQVPKTAEYADDLRFEARQEPGLAASELLCAYVLGHWDLDEQEVARLWLIGRAAGGFLPEELVPLAVLADAAPGRDVLPPDPPGYRLVRTPPLEGGGHGPGRACPGKREFPAGWSDDEVIRQTMDVAMHPSGTVELPAGTFRAYGERHGVQLSVVVSSTGVVLTSYPVSGDGVVQNPLDGQRGQHVHLLQSLLDALPPGDDEPRRSLDELMAVGEWPHVVASLQALDTAWTDQQQADLHELADLTGVLDKPMNFT